MGLCFCQMLIQEHWLQHSHLYKINDISSDFCSTRVSGMDPYFLLSCRPFGGCSFCIANRNCTERIRGGVQTHEL